MKYTASVPPFVWTSISGEIALPEVPKPHIAVLYSGPNDTMTDPSTPILFYIDDVAVTEVGLLHVS